MSTSNNPVVMSPSRSHNGGSFNLVPVSNNNSLSTTKQPSLMSNKKEKLVGKLNSLVQQLEKCCKCPGSDPDPGVVPNDVPRLPATECVRQEFRTSHPDWPCPEKPCTPTGPVSFGLKPRGPFRDIPIGGRRAVPFEIDWPNYPLITTCAVRETRFKSNKNDVSLPERTRKDIRVCLRPWLPQPVNLGGNGKAWDLQRYPSRELIESNFVLGCDCRKTNGLQDRCLRKDCRGSPACLHKPHPVCKPSGGPGPEALCPEHLNSKKRHKNNCWCPECRPSCSSAKSERDQNGRCAGCIERDAPTCGSSCEHYCSKHMSGVKEIEAVPIMC